jgi:hypothetical protein
MRGMTPPRRRRAPPEQREAPARLGPEVGGPGAPKPHSIKPGAAAPDTLPPEGPSLDDLMNGLHTLEEVIVEGDALARSVALCLLALLIGRFPTRDLQECAEDVLSGCLADNPVGPDLLATIGRLRAGTKRSVH